ncbi:MAG: T9SS type A sorting domain-containing protein [Bacteroidales bacterium]|nr:T9SS type A sorting domain-containing protein [Bacteroidales bacterium]
MGEINSGTFRVNHTCRVDDECLRDVVADYGYSYDTIFVGRIPRDYYGCHAGSFPDNPDLSLEQVVDTIPLCPYNGEPYFRDNNGIWHSFAEDSIFYMYRNIFISVLPIILVPRQDTNSSIENFDINDYCQIYPNPTSDYVEVMCNYKIYDIEITDINGRKLNKFSVDNFMTEIDLSRYPKGIYLLTLNTSKGKSTKKVIKQ